MVRRKRKRGEDEEVLLGDKKRVTTVMKGIVSQLVRMVEIACEATDAISFPALATMPCIRTAWTRCATGAYPCPIWGPNL